MGEARADPADVLLVEDNPGDVRLTEEAFREGDVATRLHVVGDGNEALAFLRREGEHADAPRPNLILLDLNLPRMNGDEVLAILEGDSEFSGIPVVVLTSSDAESDVARSYELNANAYVTKPVDPAAFIEMVRAIERFWLATVRLPDPDAG